MSAPSLQPRVRPPLATAADPPSVFVVKSLWSPGMAALGLAVSLLVCGEPLSGAYFLLGALGFLMSGDVLDVAPYGTNRYPWRTALGVVTQWPLIVGFVWALLYLGGLAGHLQARVILAWTISTPVLLCCGHYTARLLIAQLGGSGQRPRQAVIVGVTEMAVRLAQELHSDPLLGITVTGFFEDRTERMADSGARLLGRTADLPDYARRNDVDLIYITLPMTRHPRTLALLESLSDCTASVYFVPDLAAFDLVQARFQLVAGVPVVAVRESPFFGIHALVKRLTDLLFASIAVMVTAPTLIAVGIGVRLSSPGPILFKQRRYGLDGKEIIVYKFRSMTVTEDGDKDYTQVTRADRRVTRFGAFIRRTSLDELPQLFNVLEGSMSIVGPRPHAIAVNEQYRRLIPAYMIRHKIKPGITGWAQINGCRGGDDLPSMIKRIEYDLTYLRHWSLGLDLKIMFRTLTAVWNDRHAF